MGAIWKLLPKRKRIMMREGEVVATGKTKRFSVIPGVSDVIVGTMLEQLSAGDGEKLQTTNGKARLANTVNHAMMSILGAEGIKTAHVDRVNDVQFLAHRVDMIPVEVVIRFAVGEKSSYRKRNPDFTGYELPDPVVEFYFKTDGGVIGENEIGCNDPIMVRDEEKITLHHPKKPIGDDTIVHTLEGAELMRVLHHWDAMRAKALQAAHVIKDAWAEFDAILEDIKFELGVTPGSGSLVIADELTPDSWRIVWKLIELSKQPFRNDESDALVMAVYTMAASFCEIMMQRLIVEAETR